MPEVSTAPPRKSSPSWLRNQTIFRTSRSFTSPPSHDLVALAAQQRAGVYPEQPGGEGGIGQVVLGSGGEPAQVVERRSPGVERLHHEQQFQGITTVADDGAPDRLTRRHDLSAAATGEACPPRLLGPSTTVRLEHGDRLPEAIRSAETAADHVPDDRARSHGAD